VQDGLGIAVGLLGALVRSASLHVLPDDDDRQKHQLQEGLEALFDPSRIQN
jgi:hypothetical protein